MRFNLPCSAERLVPDGFDLSSLFGWRNLDLRCSLGKAAVCAYHRYSLAADGRLCTFLR